MKEYILILDKDGFGIYFPTITDAYEAAKKLGLKRLKIFSV